jgi:hypothetical protein
MDTCARCARDNSDYLSEDARMWFTPCGHVVCERCKRDVWARHRLQKCPQEECGASVAVQELCAETPAAREFAEEKRVRKRLLALFRKSLADFGGDSVEYDAHLETFEGYVHALVHGSEVEKAEVEAAVAAYKARNAHAISSSVARAQATEQRERERARAEASNKAATSRAALAKADTTRRAKEALRAHLMDLITAGPKGGAGAGSEPSDGGLAAVVALQQRLLMLQAGAKAAVGGAEAPQQWFIPVAHVPAPRFLSHVHPGWHASHSRPLLSKRRDDAACAWDTSGESLPAHARAGGHTPAAAAARVRLEVQLMLWE